MGCQLVGDSQTNSCILVDLLVDIENNKTLNRERGIVAVGVLWAWCDSLSSWTDSFLAVTFDLDFDLMYPPGHGASESTTLNRDVSLVDMTTMHTKVCKMVSTKAIDRLKKIEFVWRFVKLLS